METMKNNVETMWRQPGEDVVTVCRHSGDREIQFKLSGFSDILMKAGLSMKTGMFTHLFLLRHHDLPKIPSSYTQRMEVALISTF